MVYYLHHFTFISMKNRVRRITLPKDGLTLALNGFVAIHQSVYLNWNQRFSIFFSTTDFRQYILHINHTWIQSKKFLHQFHGNEVKQVQGRHHHTLYLSIIRSQFHTRKHSSLSYQHCTQNLLMCSLRENSKEWLNTRTHLFPLCSGHNYFLYSFPLTELNKFYWQSVHTGQGRGSDHRPREKDCSGQQ